MVTKAPMPAQGIYAILENLLRKAGNTPLTCYDLFDDPAVKRHAETANRVSDYLGHMWRRELVQRWTAPRELSNKARFAYTWKDTPPAPEPIPDKATSVRAMPDLRVLKNPLVKPNITVTEDDNDIVIDFEDFTITVRSKRK